MFYAILTPEGTVDYIIQSESVPSVPGRALPLVEDPLPADASLTDRIEFDRFVVEAEQVRRTWKVVPQSVIVAPSTSLKEMLREALDDWETADKDEVLRTVVTLLTQD